jgi:glucose-6-phosphate isomerase
MNSAELWRRYQPRVEAGKKAAASVLALPGKVLSALSASPQTAEQVAATAGAPEAAVAVYLLLEHLAADGRACVVSLGDPGQATFVRA